MNNFYQFEIEQLYKIYSVGDTKITAVNRVSLKIEKGEFISIAGHSGSGKTTLISIIGGILRPNSGKVLFEGTDICSFTDNKLSEYRNNKIGFIFQFASLLPVLTAKENVLLPKIFKSGVGSDIEKKAEEYLKMVGVGDKINSYPSQLSGGQQRRVAIARALIDPEIILADEPTGDLDENTEAEIMELFQRINDEKGVTFVVVTHSSEIAKRCKRQYRMNSGVLKED